jgi:peptidoglycan/LPS O-acetylase OafA/YrhL
MISGAVLINRLIKRLKERLTWPRTGYVSYQRKKGVQRGWGFAIGLVIGGVVAMVTTVLVMTQDLKIAVMPLLSGLLFGMLLVILGWRASIPRFYLLALLSAVLGVALAYSRLENTVGLIAYYASITVVLLFTGTCVLRTFLRQNPIPKDSPDEH